MTIRLRLALVFTAATLVLLVGGGFLFVTRLETGLRDNLDTTLALRAQSIVGQLPVMPVGASGGSGRRQAFRGSVRGVDAQLFGSNGTLLASSSGVEDTRLLTPDQVARAARRPLILDTTTKTEAAGDTGPVPTRLLARSIGHSGQVVVVALNRDVLDNLVRRATTQLEILSAVVLLLAAPGAWLLTRAALRPVERMRIEVGKLTADEERAELAVPKTRDEIARLAQTFNGLLARLHGALVRERAFVADAGHELRTPLTILKGELELARRPGRSRAELVETVDVVAEETDRLVRLTEDMLFLTSDDDSSRGYDRLFDLQAIACAAAQAMSAASKAGGNEIIVHPPRPVPATGNPDQVRQAIGNLLTNALRFSPPNVPVMVDITRAGRDVCVCVADRGPGFAPDFLLTAFERFTRADSARARASDVRAAARGYGLGLAIARSIMSRHGGTASAGNDPAGGARVTLQWPVAPPDGEASPAVGRRDRCPRP